jgi:hypothetical protein
MWQYTVTGILLAAAALYVGRRAFRALRGQDRFSCAFCDEAECEGHPADDSDSPGPDGGDSR